MSSAIEIRNLTKRYNDLTILDDISFSIDPSEFIVFLGPSGCGKSTLGRVVLRLLEATEGEVLYNGENILAYGEDKMTRMRKKMQIIFQRHHKIYYEIQ